MTLLPNDAEKYFLLFGISYVIVTNKLCLVWSKVAVTFHCNIGLIISFLATWYCDVKSRRIEHQLMRQMISCYFIMSFCVIQCNPLFIALLVPTKFQLGHTET